jgi:hypothetical protein
MRARFKGDPNRNGEGPEVLEAFGLTFLKGAWVGVDDLDPVSLRKLHGNSHFEVSEGKAGKGQPAAAATPAAEPVKRGRKAAADKPSIADAPAKSEDDDWGDLDPEA